MAGPSSSLCSLRGGLGSETASRIEVSRIKLLGQHLYGFQSKVASVAMALAPSMPLAPSAPLAPWTTGSRRRPSTPAILNICNQPARSDRSQQDFGFHKIRFIATRVRTTGVESGQEPREVWRQVTTGWRRPRWSPRLQVVQVVQVQVV